MKHIPKGSLYRLLRYLRTLEEFEQLGISVISSEGLGELSESTAAQVRRDLSFLGTFGTRGLGYDVSYLAKQIHARLGLETRHPVALVGYGRIGSALLQYPGLKRKGYDITAIFDKDQEKIGEKVGKILIRSFDEIDSYCKRERINLGIIATPAEVAQGVAEKLISGNVQKILNFAPVQLKLNNKVIVRDVDLTLEFQFLSVQ